MTEESVMHVYNDMLYNLKGTLSHTVIWMNPENIMLKQNKLL